MHIKAARRPVRLPRALFFFFCVCENDGDPLISQNDLRLSAASLPLLFLSLSIFRLLRGSLMRTHKTGPLLPALTLSINGIVLETLPPSHLPATHAGALSSISAISFASMRLPRWPKHSRVAAPWRKRGYLLESSRWRSLSLMRGGLAACFCNKVAR